MHGGRKREWTGWEYDICPSLNGAIPIARVNTVITTMSPHEDQIIWHLVSPGLFIFLFRQVAVLVALVV
ncbi:hypothetical protein BDV26DRAFT_156101 [Aspergillus bertholletiae]|uniref:Uncharacterized protein n=1 Tax=Aspergillus bertholletiae TaxID=1226010 RepID=A0A5N7BD80_9EURO|nr:hypothetical protein BDV26DRAFT_156101 [Aspergillus bertholletiae]